MPLSRTLVALACSILPLAAMDCNFTAMPPGLTTGPGWALAEDPGKSGNHVLAFDGQAQGGNSELTLADPQLVGPSWSLRFRSRYQTQFPGLAIGKQPDGQHFPHWSLTIGDVTLDDSYVWNALIVSGVAGSANAKRIEGARPQDAWVDWRVARNGKRLQVWINDQSAADLTLAGETGGPLVIKTMHLKLWLDDLATGPWKELKDVVSDGRDPDRPEWSDFEDGLLPRGWRANGPWKVGEDPEKPGNKVLFGSSDQMVMRLLSQRQDHLDYRLRYRVRFSTPWPKPFPFNDSVHFPNWSSILRQPVEGAALAWADDYVWSGQGLKGPYQPVGVGQPRLLGRDRWTQVEATLSNGHVLVTLDGSRQAEGQVLDGMAGAIGFHLQSGDLWIDDLALTLHPKAKLYENWAEGLDAKRWNGVGWTVQEVEGNRCAVAGGAADDAGWLAHHHGQAEALQAVRVSTLTTGGWDLCVAGDPAARWLGVRARGGALELGTGEGDTWTTLTKATGTVPADGTWHRLRAEVGHGTVRVLLDGNPCAEGPLPAGLAAGVLAVRDAGAGLRVDDLLVADLPQPVVATAPSEDCGIFQPGETQGMLVEMRNPDEASHRMSARLEVVDATGKAVGTARWDEVIEAGGSRTRVPLSVTLPVPGEYTARTLVACEGVEVLKGERPLLLLPALPKASLAWRNRFALVGGFESTAMRKIGVGMVRGGPPFNGVDIGRRTFTEADQLAAIVKDWGIQSNSLYQGDANGFKPEGLQQIPKIFADVAKHWAGRNDLHFTVWNEPNHGAFWRGSPASGWDYGAMLIACSRAAKAAAPGTSIWGPGTSGVPTDFIADTLAAGAGPYLDILNYHPYGYPKPPEQLLPDGVAKANAAADRFIAWVDHAHTEGGYPTTTTGAGVSEQDQASYMVRWQLLINATDRQRWSHFYMLWDCGDDDTNVEHRFGMIRTSKAHKPSYWGLAMMARMLSNSRYCGDLATTPGSFVQAYRRFDGSAVLAAWAPTGAKVELKLGGKPVVRDLYGRQIAVGEGGNLNLALTGQPVWIEGFTADTADQGIQQAVTERAKRLATRITERLPEARRTAAGSAATGAVEAIKQALAQPRGAARDTALRAGIDRLTAMAAGEITTANGHEQELAAALVAEDCYHLLAHAVVGLAASGADPTTQVAAAQQAVATRSPAGVVLPHSRRIAARAAMHLTAASASDAGEAAFGERELAKLCSTWAAALAAHEMPWNWDTVANVIFKFHDTAPGNTVRSFVTATNGEGHAVTMRSTFTMPVGWAAVTPVERILQPGESWEQPVDLVVPKDAATTTHGFSATVAIDGKPFRTFPMKIAIGAPARVEMRGLVGDPAATKSVVATVTTPTAAAVSGTLTVNWPGQAALGAVPVQVAGNSTASVILPFTVPPATTDNAWFLDGKLLSADGAVQWTGRLPVSVPRVKRAVKPPVIDGKLDEYAHAWAVHCAFTGGNSPSPEDISAVGWTLWDEQNLYVALRVRDDFHNQQNATSDMWKGDSLQMGLDPAGKRTEGAYLPGNDYELGFALADGGKMLKTQWVGPDAGLSEACLLAIRRDEAAKETCYEIAIPIARLKLPSKAGTVFGLNLALNDVDRNFGREDTAQVTSGVCDAKNPSAWLKWVLEP